MSKYDLYGNEDDDQDDVLQRSADEELDNMVQRNIRDVLQQAGVVEEGPDEGSPHRQQPDMGRESSQLYGRGSTSAFGKDSEAVSFAPGSNSNSSAVAHNSRPPGSRRLGSEGQQQRTSLTASAPGPKLRSQDHRVGPGGVTAASRRSVEGPSADGNSTASLLDVPGQPEASLRLHKARIKALEEDMNNANKLLLERERQLTDALREVKELRAQAASWARDKKALEAQLDRTKKQATEAESALRSTESQVRELAKADSRGERERRASEAEVRARDVRLQRALEEVERYKQLLNDVRVQEREVKGSAQQDAGRLVSENRKLERQRAELITAFKKQLKLIEVLKRQKVHLEAARALQFSEEEFLKTLEMGAS